eukprot:TRINITY_DN18659_c0_g1_i1.p1 TRINITY_DN18659_c0_g1~~TRINITY_DN18659_c0_g1_i1.p1  ORF type:complete len:347 (+),score=83.76 TRINITY_DN18659_c0_g1_i1:81-1043(+)
MRSSVVVVLLFFLATCISGETATTGNLLLTVSYCTTNTSSLGAVVQEYVDACPVWMDPPVVSLDRSSETLYMYFISEGTGVVLDLARGVMKKTFGAIDPFFLGLYTMEYFPTLNILKGCLRYSDLTLVGGWWVGHQFVQFQSIVNQAHYFDLKNNVYWVQATGDLRKTTCGASPDDQCLLALNGDTGALQSATYTNFTLYSYGPTNADGSPLVFAQGFDICNSSGNALLFANLEQGTLNPVACVARDLVLGDDGSWASAFSIDGSLLATGSGTTGNGPPSQLVVLSTTTGAAMLNTSLNELVETLGSKGGQLAVWGISWI